MKKTTLNELNEMYKDAPKRTSEYEIDGKKFIVTSHFVGTKDLDKTMYQLHTVLRENTTFQIFGEQSCFIGSIVTFIYSVRISLQIQPAFRLCRGYVRCGI